MSADHAVKHVRFGLILSLLLLAAACGARISEELEAQLLELVALNTQYLNAEDIEGYMGTLHPDSPVYEGTRSTLELMFEAYDLSNVIEEAEVLSVSADTATVRVVQVTRKLAGAQPFRDNRIEAVHTFRKDASGEWKIYESAFEEVEYLESGDDG